MPGAVLEVAVAAKAFVARPRRLAAREPVLRDVHFRVSDGETVALFGPSGVGKTTLLRLVLGLDVNFSGQVSRPPGAPGVMFQEPRLAPWLSVAQNLRLVAPRASDAAIALLLEDMGLSGLEALRPGELSGGMARRVALARALVARPGWLVLDEPFASLDPGNTAMLAGVVSASMPRAPSPTGCW